MHRPQRPLACIMHVPVRLWQRAPFIRYFTALAAGIALQETFSLPVKMLVCSWALLLMGMVSYFLLSLKLRYRFALLNGVMIHLALLVSGALLLWRHDVRHRRYWIGQSSNAACLAVRLEEAPVKKQRSWKAQARVEWSSDGTRWQPAEGSVLLYFEPDSMTEALSCGSRVVFQKTLQPIPEANNPGSFSYARYCLYQGITHQVYLKRREYRFVKEKPPPSLERLVLAARQYVVGLLRANIAGTREQGLAEALLIGYKDDLDKQLVQSYTRTGVVHIIAISGMHLALIYGLLSWLTKPLARVSWFRLLLILAGLWGFSLLTGGGASVVRSTVMFSFVVLGNVLKRKMSVYNSLALSAFLLLCYQPYWLWDVGFQLSYGAVLSIVIFYRPVYGWADLTHPLLDAVWKSMAVSLAAQILTTPLSLYHFHQFPVLFLLTNLIAVPLSSLVLMGEIGICALGWMHGPALLLGKCTAWMIGAMNAYIERLDRTSFAVWDGFSLSLVQMALLIALIAALHYWLSEKERTGFTLALLSLLCFCVLRTLDFWNKLHQQKLIVYSASHHTLIEFVSGRDSYLLSDPPAIDENTKAYCLRPAHTLMRLREPRQAGLSPQLIRFCGKKVLVLCGKPPPAVADTVDLVIVSGRIKRGEEGLPEQCLAACLVIDGSVPAASAARWMRMAEERHIPYHNIAQKGAFVVNL